MHLFFSLECIGTLRESLAFKSGGGDYWIWHLKDSEIEINDRGYGIL